MPKFAKLDWQDFVFLENELKNMGYQFLNKRDFARTFTRLDLEAPRPIYGREEGCIFTKNGLTVFLWTTAVRKDQIFREAGTDAGRAGIKMGDKVLYMTKDIPRTPGFIMRFLRYAWILKWKVENRPLCKHCHADMYLFQNKTTRQTMWVCNQKEKHPSGRGEILGWDMNIGPKAKAFLDIRRVAFQKYKKGLKKAGKTTTPRRKKVWKINRPDNMVGI